MRVNICRNGTSEVAPKVDPTTLGVYLLVVSPSIVYEGEVGDRNGILVSAASSPSPCDNIHALIGLAQVTAVVVGVIHLGHQFFCYRKLRRSASPSVNTSFSQARLPRLWTTTVPRPVLPRLPSSSTCLQW